MPVLLSNLIKIKLEKLLENVGDMALKRRARKIVEELNPKEGEKILDLGCGTGYYLFLLSSLPVKLDLTGFDHDIKALKEAEHFLKGRKIEFVLGDSHVLPFKDNTFDKIVASEVLEHVADDKQVLGELYRVLKRKGVLIISVPSINYPFLWDPTSWIFQHIFGTHIKKGFFAGIWNQHVRLYERNDLKVKFEKSGFKILIIQELTYWCLPFNHYIVNLVARLLYDIKISKKMADKLSKFKVTKKPFLIDSAFRLVSLFDGLNEVYPHRNGVNIFVKAEKP